MRSSTGGLADVMTNEDFVLDDGNQSYWFMDLSAMYKTEKESYK